MSVFHGTFIMIGIFGSYLHGLRLALLYIFLYFFVVLEFFCSLLALNRNSFIFLTDLKKLNCQIYCLGILILAFLGMSGLPPFFCFWAKIGIVALMFSREL
jgi:NADH:ubiquinone oxidoreductase subunit 2 (subunit N)